MKNLNSYINEQLSDLLKDEKDWIKVSSSEYSIYIEDKPELFDMIPYKEFNLHKPDSILVTLKKDGSKWFGIIKWTCPKHIDKYIYICAGWKCESTNANDLADKMHKIMNHLSKSETARDKFKQLILSYKKDIDNYNSKNLNDPIDPKQVIMSYNKDIHKYSLEQLLKY